MVFDPITAALGGGQLGLGIYGALQSRKASKKARKRQKELIASTLGTYDKLIRRYAPSGRYGQLARKELRQSQEQEIGRGVQQRLRSGIGGTTYGDYFRQYQTQTGRQQRRKLESLLADKQSAIEQQKASFLGGINVRGPSAEQVGGGFAQAAQGLGTLLGAFGGASPKGGSETQTSLPPVPIHIPGQTNVGPVRRRRFIKGLKPQSGAQAYSRLMQRQFTLPTF